jgi:hypothetical protein
MQWYAIKDANDEVMYERAETAYDAVMAATLKLIEESKPSEGFVVEVRGGGKAKKYFLELIITPKIELLEEYNAESESKS